MKPGEVVTLHPGRRTAVMWTNMRSGSAVTLRPGAIGMVLGEYDPRAPAAVRVHVVGIGPGIVNVNDIIAVTGDT